MGDFVSQATLDAGLTLVPDALGHEQTALAILQKTVFLEPGSVIAIQGSWGRGKTDVLMRIAALVRDPAKAGIPDGLIADALWINPWQYGTPDLLTPLVLAMLDRVPEEPRRNDKRLRKLAEALLRAGVSFGMKAVGTAVPILSLAADPVEKMIVGLFEAAGMKSEAPKEADPDPVAKMGERFRELAQVLLDLKQKQEGARLIVCVDDLDRCLPDRQVALLEAIRFLISAGAPVTFLIALDPTLARQAIITHYQTDAFDPDRYLDKMFDLRVNLPSLGARIGDLVRHHMEREVKALGATMKIGAAMEALLGGQAAAKLEEAAKKALAVPDLSNPRVVRRVFDRLYLLAVSRSAAKLRPLSLTQPREYRNLLVWIGVAERFPAVRAAVQAAGVNFDQRFDALCAAYTFGASRSTIGSSMPPATGPRGTSSLAPPTSESIRVEERSPHDNVVALYHLPSIAEAPELSDIFGLFSDKSGNEIRQLDAALVEAGL